MQIYMLSVKTQNELAFFIASVWKYSTLVFF